MGCVGIKWAKLSQIWWVFVFFCWSSSLGSTSQSSCLQRKSLRPRGRGTRRRWPREGSRWGWAETLESPCQTCFSPGRSHILPFEKKIMLITVYITNGSRRNCFRVAVVPLAGLSKPYHVLSQSLMVYFLYYLSSINQIFFIHCVKFSKRALWTVPV